MDNMVETNEILRKELQQLYWEKRMSFSEISKQMEIPRATLFVLFEKFGIKTRSPSKGLKAKWKRKKQQLRKEQKERKI